MAQLGRVHPACPDASNPYHQCAEYCIKKIAEAAKPQKDKKGSLSFGRRNKKGSGSIPDSPQSIENMYSQFFAKKKVEERNSEHSSSSPSYSDDISSRDSSFNKGSHQIDSSQLLLPMSANLKHQRPQEPSKNSEAPRANETLTNQEEHRKPPPSRVVHATEESDEEEAEPVISDSSSRVRVAKYRVKSSVSSTLESIFRKHGDIAVRCQLESLALRAYYLECVCFVVQELQCTPFKYLTKSKVKEMLAILKDVEAAKIDVSWLRRSLDEISEALELVGQQRVAEVTKAKCEQDLEKTRKELETEMEDLARKEKEVADAQARVAETKARLNELQVKSSQLKDTMSTLRSKVERINYEALLDKIL